jgi:4-amino-4-deoxy-L-arabinose transferase-like glycosyltransferase
MKVADKARRMRNGAVKIARLNIWLVLGFALFLRTLLPITGYFYTRDATIFYTPDSASYIAPAHELIAYHRFFSEGSPEGRGSNSPIAPAPEIIRTPAYPLLLTAGLLMGPLELVTIALQILLSCFTVYLVYRTAGLVFESERIALVAALLYSIDPLSILFSSLLSTETLFTAIVMVAVYYLVRYLKRQLLVDLLVSGGALAASVYVRPIGYFLPLVIAAGMAAWTFVTHRQNQLRVLAHTCAFVIVSIGLTGLWQIRNKIETGYSGFSAIASDNLYFISAASVLAAQQRVPYYGMRDRLGYQDQRIYFQEHPEQRTWPVAQRIDYMNRAANHICSAAP